MTWEQYLLKAINLRYGKHYASFASVDLKEWVEFQSELLATCIFGTHQSSEAFQGVLSQVSSAVFQQITTQPYTTSNMVQAVNDTAKDIEQYKDQFFKVDPWNDSSYPYDRADVGGGQ